jgi:hypothetical protein
MDTLIEFISQPTASTLGFAGIAFMYISIAIFDKKSEWPRLIAKIAYIFAGCFLVYLAYRCQLMGTVKNVDAGIVLAYLGIGAGLIGSAWAAHDNFKRLSWVIFGIGVSLEIFALILIGPVGII